MAKKSGEDGNQSGRFDPWNESLSMQLEMRYDDLVIKAGDAGFMAGSPSRAKGDAGLYPGHKPIYASEQSFFDVYDKLCKKFSVRNRIAEEAGISDPADEDLGDYLSPESKAQILLETLTDIVDRRGLNYAEANILSAMLGYSETERTQFVSKALEEKLTKVPRSAIRETLTLAQNEKIGTEEAAARINRLSWNEGSVSAEAVKEAWEEEIAKLTPNYREILGAPVDDKDDVAADAVISPPKVKKQKAPSAPTAPSTARSPAQEERRKRGRPTKHDSRKQEPPRHSPENPDQPAQEFDAGEAFQAFGPSELPKEKLALAGYLESLFEQTIGKDKLYPTHLELLRALATCCKSFDAALQFEVTKESWPENCVISKDEALVLAVVLNLRTRDEARFYESVMQHNALILGRETGDYSKAWQVQPFGIEEDVLRNAMPIIWHTAVTDKGPLPPLSNIKQPVAEPERKAPAPKTPQIPITTPSASSPVVATPPASVEEPIVPPPAVAIGATEAPKTEEPSPPLNPPPTEEATPQNTSPEKKGGKPPAETSPPDTRSDAERQTLYSQAIERAKVAYDTMTKYDEKRAQEIATRLLRDLFDASVHANASWRGNALSGMFGNTVSTQICDGIFNKNKLVFFETLGVKNTEKDIAPADAFVNALEIKNPELANEARMYLTGIPLAKIENPADDLLTYARTHHTEMLDYMTMLRHFHRMDLNDFSKVYLGGMNRARLNNLYSANIKTGAHTAPSGKEDVNAGTGEELATKHQDREANRPNKKGEAEIDTLLTALEHLGFQNPESKRAFRQMAMNIPPEYSQEMLNGCFEPHGEQPALVNERTDTLPADTRKTERTRALSNFLDLLMKVHGLREFKELAQTITKQEKTNGHALEEKANDLQRAINNRACRYRGDKREIHERSSILFGEEHAQMIAQFAFPDRDDLQQRCINFLSNRERYGKIDHSEKLDRAWVTRKAKAQSPLDHATRPASSDDDAPGNLG